MLITLPARRSDRWSLQLNGQNKWMREPTSEWQSKYHNPRACTKGNDIGEKGMTLLCCWVPKIASFDVISLPTESTHASATTHTTTTTSILGTSPTIFASATTTSTTSYLLPMMYTQTRTQTQCILILAPLLRINHVIQFGVYYFSECDAITKFANNSNIKVLEVWRCKFLLCAEKSP